MMSFLQDGSGHTSSDQRVKMYAFKHVRWIWWPHVKAMMGFDWSAVPVQRKHSTSVKSSFKGSIVSVMRVRVER